MYASLSLNESNATNGWARFYAIIQIKNLLKKNELKSAVDMFNPGVKQTPQLFATKLL